MKNILKTYFELRQSLVKNKLQELEIQKEIISNLSPMHQLKEFKTLNLDFGRQTGSSYFMLDWLAKDNNINETVVYVHSLIQEKEYKKILKSKGINNPTFCHYKNYDGIDKYLYKYVIIDISSCVKNQDLKNINNYWAIDTLKLMLHI